MQSHRLSSLHSLMLAGVVSGAIAVPASALVARDAVVSSAPTPVAIDLRSPDAQDVGQPTPVAVDLRSPDAAQPVSLPAIQPRVASQPAPSANDGFDVTSALVGAGIAALLALCAVLVARTRGRRHGVGTPHGVAPLGG